MENGFRAFMLKSFAALFVSGAGMSAIHYLEEPVELYAVFFNPAFDTVFSAALAFYAFCVLTREKIPAMGAYSFRKKEAAVFGLIALAFLGLRYSFPVQPMTMIFSFAAMLLFFAAAYGLRLTKFLARNYWKQLIGAATVFGAAYWLIKQNFLLGLSVHATYALLKLTESTTLIDWATKWPTLTISGFREYVSPYCSGIESMTLFSLFFLFMVVLRHEKIRGTRFLPYYFAGLLGAYLMTIVRLYGLFMVGAIFGKEMASGLFHSLASLILFGIYFVVYWFIARDLMVPPKRPGTAEN